MIDYTEHDFTKLPNSYDLIIDTTGNVSYADCKPILNPTGRLVLVAANLVEMLAMPWVALTSQHKLLAGPTSTNQDTLISLAHLAQQGKYRPVIDQEFAFEQMVDAHRYVETGRKKGNVVIRLESIEAA